MRLESLDMISVDGIPDRLKVEFGDGLNIIFGANGAGKSTMARLIHDDLFVQGANVRGEADLSWSLNAGADAPVIHRLRPHGGEAHPFAARLPTADHAACYLLRAADLLATEGENDREIARRLQREMAGGLDLPALRSALHQPDPRQDARSLGKALDELREAETRQAGLAGEEEEIALLENRIEEARAARDRLDLLDARRRMLEQEDEREPRVTELEAMPPEVERVPEAAATAREDRRRAFDQARLRCRRKQEELAAHQNEIEAAWAGRRCFAETEVDRLRSLSLELPDLRRQRDEAARKSAAACHRLSGREALLALHEQAPDDEIFLALTKQVESTTEAELEVKALENERARLTSDPTREEEEDADELRRGLDALERWLAPLADDPLALRNRLSIGLILVVLGLILHLTLAWPYIIALSGVGLGILWVEFQSRGQRQALRAAAAAEYAGATTGLEIRFERTEVQRARKTLQQRIVAAEARDHRDQARAQIDARLTVDRPRAEQLRRELRAALTRHEIKDRGGMTLLNLDHFERVKQARLDEADRRDAEQAIASAEEGLDRVQTQARALSNAVSARLPDDLDDLSAGLDRLAEENTTLNRLLVDREKAARELADLQNEAQEAELRLQTFHDPLGIDPDDEGAFRRLDGLASRRQVLRSELGKIEALIEVEALKLEDRPDILELVGSELEAAVQEAGQMSADLETLRDRRATILARIEAALDGRSLAIAIEARDQARATLESKREDALGANLQLLLLDRLAGDEDHRVESRVLESSRRYFARFTRESWSLEVLDDSLAAKESASGQLRSLAALSDGTRVQLLMAARIAFLESIEQDEKIPLMLDEVLATADPLRFAAIAEVLLQEARDGRQVLYFTADPHDVMRLEDLAKQESEADIGVIDLAACRGAQGAAWRQARTGRELSIAPPVPIPGEGARAYAEALGLQRPDWRAGAPALHLFHLLSDRLKTLHLLLENGITTLGVWRTARKSGSAELILPDLAERERLDILGRAAQRLLDRIGVGRGRIMKSVDLEPEFGKYTIFEPMCEILERENGDAGSLIEAIERKEIANFRAAHLEKLKELAEEGGFVPDRAPLTDDELIQESLGLVAADIEAGRTELQDLTAVLRRLLTDLPPGERGE